MTNEITKISAEEQKMLNQAFFGHCGWFFGVCNIYMGGRGFANGMIPALRYFYKDPDEFNENLNRHLELFNTHTIPEGLIAGLAIAMEKEKAEKGTVTGDSITSIKAALMGPLAGIGDSFFFNCVRVIVAGIAIGFSSKGSVLGPILFILFYGCTGILLKYWFFMTAYKSGTKLIEQAFSEGLIPLLTKAASIVGMTMAGAMIATNIRITLAFEPVINGAKVSIQGVIDQFMPGLLSIALWYVCLRAFKKGTSPTKVVLTILVCCIILAAVGVF